MTRIGTPLRDWAATDPADRAGPLTQAEVDALPDHIPRVVVEDSTVHPGYWTWVDPAGVRRYRVHRWHIPALHHEHPTSYLHEPAAGSRLIVLLPPEE